MLWLKLCRRVTRYKHRSWLNLDHLKFFRGKKKKERSKTPYCCFFFHVLVKHKQLQTGHHNAVAHCSMLTGDAEISSLGGIWRVTAQGALSSRHHRQHSGFLLVSD